jgi:CDP-glucose 4,6-dehydratase
MGSDLEPDVHNEASNEIKDQYLDAAKARTMLGWSRAFAFEASLRATVDWYTRYFAAPGRALETEPETEPEASSRRG